eukprot:360015-Alexandrium_andersonii.AAC.1
MSASLVGLGDVYKRQPLRLPREGPALHAQPGIFTSQSASRTRPVRAATVSYTHLTLPTICSV